MMRGRGRGRILLPRQDTTVPEAAQLGDNRDEEQGLHAARGEPMPGPSVPVPMQSTSREEAIPSAGQSGAVLRRLGRGRPLTEAGPSTPGRPPEVVASVPAQVRTAEVENVSQGIEQMNIRKVGGRGQRVVGQTRSVEGSDIETRQQQPAPVTVRTQENIASSEADLDLDNEDSVVADSRVNLSDASTPGVSSTSGAKATVVGGTQRRDPNPVLFEADEDISPRGGSPSEASPRQSPPRNIEQQEVQPEIDEDDIPRQDVESTETPLELFRGKTGSSVKVMGNFLRLTASAGKGIFQYDVKFDPHLEDTRTRKDVILQFGGKLGVPHRTFDGMKLTLPIMLTPDKLKFTTRHPNIPSSEIVAKLRPTNVAHKDTVQFYNVLINRCMQALGFVQIKNDYFNPNKLRPLPQYNLEVWPGFRTSIDYFEGGLMICVNTTTRVLRKDTLLEQLRKCKLKNSDSRMYRKEFEDLVLNSTVITRYNDKHYKVHEVIWTESPRFEFQRGDRKMTLVEYYKEQYGKEITDMTQPLITSRIKRRKNDPRGESYFVSLVPEFCCQSGLTDELRGNMLLMRELVNISRTSPMQRHAEMKEFLFNLTQNPKAAELLDAWGLVVDKECAIGNARTLQGPPLLFKNLKLNSANADFSREATSNACYQPIPLKRWQIYCAQGDKDKAERTVQVYRQVSSSLGISFGPDPELIIVQTRSGRGFSALDLRQSLRTKARQDQVQFVMVILPIARDDLYQAVKRHCLTDNSIPSQVILQRTLSQDKKLRPVMQKVALQINCKLGGSLWCLNIPFKDRTMFVGIDSHHDAKDSKKSCLALVAALDNGCTSYFSRTVRQQPRQESADLIRPLFQQSIFAYFQANQTYPTRVIVFRDGVSDGEMETVKINEADVMKALLNQTCEVEPKFLFIVVQKRINERFFGIKGNNLENPVPGTVIDADFTRRNMYDFFMVSQLVRQGTVSPSHFVVLEDTERNADLAQRYSYVTTYMYFNWPGSVRVPAMCQYAHKLAMLVGQHLEGEPLAGMDNQLYYL